MRRLSVVGRSVQVGEQDLALGFKFNARGTIDCYEGEIEALPAGARRREIAFNMVDGDFKIFEGKWSVEEVTMIMHYSWSPVQIAVAEPNCSPRFCNAITAGMNESI